MQQERKKINAHRQKEVRLFLFIDDIIIYVGNSKVSPNLPVNLEIKFI